MRDGELSAWKRRCSSTPAHGKQPHVFFFASQQLVIIPDNLVTYGCAYLDKLLVNQGNQAEERDTGPALNQLACPQKKFNSGSERGI
jgi:hypothetical protein